MAVVTFSNIKGSGGGTLTGITFLNSDYTLDFIESAVTEAVDSALTGYTKTVDFATINGSAITEGGNLVIEAGDVYSAGTNIDITENVISVTGITIPTSNTAFTNDAGYITSGEAQTQINDSISGLATTEYVDNSVSGKMDASGMSAYTTTSEVEDMINDSISGKADASALTAYTPTSGFSTINGSAITSGDNLVIEGTPYSGGTGIDITDHVVSVTGDYETVIELTQQQYDALTAYSENTTYIITDAHAIDMSAYTPTSGFSTINGSAITEGGNITVEETPYSAGTNIAISDHVISVTGISVPTKVSDLQNDLNFVDSGDVQTQINDSVSGKQDSSAMTEYYTSAQTDSAISNAVTAATSGLASETYVDNAVSGKADTSALTQYWTSAETQNAITAATDDMATQTWVGQQGYLTAFTETDPIFQASAASGITSQDISDWNAKLDSSALTPYYTSAQTDTAISNATSGLASTTYVDNAVSGKVDTSAMTEYYTSAQTDTQIANATSALASTTYVDNSVSGKQDTLVSGQNIKTINSQSILGSGDIVISGGSANIIELTQAEYDALTAYTQDTLYIISDAPSIELVASITSASTDTQFPSAKAVYDLINGN